MHALFFEVRPFPGHLEHYFEHVARLRPVLSQHQGMAFLDRYASLSEPDLLLSHQLWESEQAIIAWRTDCEHLRSQDAGRTLHFADYRIRVGARVLKWQAGQPEPSIDLAAAADVPHVVAWYGSQAALAPNFASFESVNRSGNYISLATVQGFAEAEEVLRSQIDTKGLKQAAAFSIRRDYGQFDRVQAPR